MRERPVSAAARPLPAVAAANVLPDSAPAEPVLPLSAPAEVVLPSHAASHLVENTSGLTEEQIIKMIAINKEYIETLESMNNEYDIFNEMLRTYINAEKLSPPSQYNKIRNNSYKTAEASLKEYCILLESGLKLERDQFKFLKPDEYLGMINMITTRTRAYLNYHEKMLKLLQESREITLKHMQIYDIPENNLKSKRNLQQVLRLKIDLESFTVETLKKYLAGLENTISGFSSGGKRRTRRNRAKRPAKKTRSRR